MKKVDPEGDILKSSSLRREAMETNREKDKRKRSCTQNLSRFALLEILLTITSSLNLVLPSFRISVAAHQSVMDLEAGYGGQEI